MVAAAAAAAAQTQEPLPDAFTLHCLILLPRLAT